MFVNKQMDYFRLSMKKNDEDKDHKTPLNPPKGFEKFFKKRDEEKKEAEKTSSGNKDDKHEKKQADDESITDEEDAAGDKTKKTESEKKSPLGDPTSFKNSLNNFFFDPKGGPVFENWIVALLLTGAFFYYLTLRSPS